MADEHLRRREELIQRIRVLPADKLPSVER